VLGGFRTTARAWAEEVRLEVALGPVAAKPWSFRGLRLAAAMALVLLCFGLLMTRTQFTGKVGNQQANELSTGAADDAVLERVDAALSRSAPSAMEPLSQLVPTDHKVKTGDVN
jgi:hypothetical protein